MVLLLICIAFASASFFDVRRDVPGSADRFYSSLFQEPLSASGWVNFYNGNGYSQRYLISSARGGNLFCETKTRIRASPKRVLAALQGPWTWWRGGAYDNRQVLPSGEISYELWPALAFGRSRVGVHVFERMSPPIQIPGGFRIPLQLAGSCSGQAYFELTSDDGGASTTVVGRFAAVSNHVLVMTDRIFVETHLKAERGGLTLPFKPGTGWPGLKDLLENNQRPRSPADILRGN